MLKTKKLMKILGAFVLFGGIAAGTWLLIQSQSRASSPSLGQRHRTVQVKPDTFRWTISATGIVEPKYTTEIRSIASGEIKTVRVEVGMRVKRGQLLVQLDPKQESRRVKQAQAQLSIAQANYLKARRVYSHALSKRNSSAKLAKKGVVSREELVDLEHQASVRKAERSVAYAQVRNAKEKLKEALDRLKDTQVRAPEDGVILQRHVQPGQVITSGANSASGGTLLFKMAELSNLYVRADVDESDVVRLQAKMKAAVTIDALPGKRFSGQIIRINPEGKSQNNVTVFEVIVKLDAKAARVMKLNMTTNLKFVVLEKKDVLLLPSLAIHKRRRSKGVYMLEDGKVRFKKVKAGLSNGIHTVVSSGLSRGDVVLLSPPRAKGKKSRRGRRSNGRRSNGRRQMRQMRRMMR